jgi:hypothetical protein
MIHVTIGGVGSDERKKAVRKYFAVTPLERDLYWARALLGIAVACLLLAITLLVLARPGVAALAGIVSIVAAQQGVEQRNRYWMRWNRAEPKPSDAQMDDLIRSDLRRAAERALDRLGLTRDELELRSFDVDPLRAGPRLADQGQGPITVFGPADGVLVARRGVDRTWRFTSYDIMVICPTGHHLGIYECRLDMASGRKRNEETREYHYDDVVAVGTATRGTSEVAFETPSQYRLILGRALVRSFEVIVSSGDRSSIVVGIKDEEEPDNSFELQESGIDKVIYAVRRMLREKKGKVGPPM